MKLNIFTVFIPALLVASSANATEIYNTNNNKLDIYGKIAGVHYFSLNKYYNGSKSRVKLGIKGETKINDFLTGYGQWEYNVPLNNSEVYVDPTLLNNITELGFTGLKFGNYGSFDYGRNYGILYDVKSWTDMMPEFGGETVEPDNFLSGRASNLATYRNNNFFNLVDGLNFALQLQAPNNERSVTQRSANGLGFGLSTSYTSPYGFGIIGAYSHSKRANPLQTQIEHVKFAAIDKPAISWSGAIKYDANDIYLALMYGKTQRSVFMKDFQNQVGFANETKMLELVAQYQFNFGLRPSVAYVEHKATQIEDYEEVDLSKYIDLSATYSFNKQMSAYVDYRINTLHQNFNQLNKNIDDVAAFGLVYKF